MTSVAIHDPVSCPDQPGRLSLWPHVAEQAAHVGAPVPPFPLFSVEISSLPPRTPPPVVVQRREENKEPIPSTIFAQPLPLPEYLPQRTCDRLAEIIPAAPSLEEILAPEFFTRVCQKKADKRFVMAAEGLVYRLRQALHNGGNALVPHLLEALRRRTSRYFSFRTEHSHLQISLFEDLLSSMYTQSIEEYLNPKELFLLLNFQHWCHCLASDCIARMCRQEGLRRSSSAARKPSDRPLHVPAHLRTSIGSGEDRNTGWGSRTSAVTWASDVPDTHSEDAIARVEAQLQAAWILSLVPDPLNRKILLLRTVNELEWLDIAKHCAIAERTARYRYRKTLSALRTSHTTVRLR